MQSVAKLISIASPPLSAEVASSAKLSALSSLGGEAVAPLLSARNGFYAFEAAFYMRPLISQDGHIGLLEWNRRSLWVDDYDGLAEGAVFFAEDVFGGQFCVRAGSIESFDPETGAFAPLAADAEHFAKVLLADFEVLTGYPLAHAWQSLHGPLQTGQRLVPKIPFVLGGDFAVDNLMAIDAIEGMRWRADLSRQIRDLPDGSQVTLKVVD